MTPAEAIAYLRDFAADPTPAPDVGWSAVDTVKAALLVVLPTLEPLPPGSLGREAPPGANPNEYPV